MDKELILFLCIMSNIFVFMLVCRSVGSQDFIAFALSWTSMIMLVCASLMLM